MDWNFENTPLANYPAWHRNPAGWLDTLYDIMRLPETWNCPEEELLGDEDW